MITHFVFALTFRKLEAHFKEYKKFESAIKNKNFIYICMSINCTNSKIFILGMVKVLASYFILALYLTDELRKA